MWSDTRAACCMLCVTMMIVYSPRSSPIRSSMRVVERGSKRRTGLVHQDDLRIDGDRPGDAQPLVLPAGKPQRRSCSRSLTSSQSAERRRLFSTASSSTLAIADAGDPQPVGDVLVDRLGKRHRLLKYHADSAAQFNHVQRGVVDFLAVQQDVAGDRGRRRSGRSCG